MYISEFFLSMVIFNVGRTRVPGKNPPVKVERSL